MNKTWLSIFSTAAVILVLAGCRSQPTLGDRMSGHGDVAKRLGSDWSRGNAMVKKGTKLQNESEKLLQKGQSKHDQAQQLLAEGQQLQQSSQVAFKNKFGSVNR